MFVFINGKFVTEKNAKISALDNGLLYGDGFYDTMRTYEGKILEHDLHLKRIPKSAKLLGIKLPYSVKKIGDFTKELVRRNGVADGRARVTITRGTQGFDFLHSNKSTLVITAEEIKVNKKDYSSGVAAFTMPLTRTLPEIKTLGLTVMIQAYRTILPRGAYEALLTTPKGEVSEGASTNIFLVKNGKIITPGEGILNGLTRQRAIILARSLGMTVAVRAVKKKELYAADEIFLTNRPREIIPVVKVDGKRIGTGKVGTITQQIMDSYQKYITTSLRLKKRM